jgi:ubiquinone/menaquinone biosynthesis C-methylase UbiE
MDSRKLFSNKAEAYAQARPTYPKELIEFLIAEAGLGSESLVADIGGGTGLSAFPFLEQGIPLVLVEPNQAMREVGEVFLSSFRLVSFSSGSGEETGLEDSSIDLVFCGQSFHWMNPDLANVEFRRILKPTGLAALAWNVRRSDDEVQKAFDGISEEFGGERFQRIKHDDLIQDFSAFFSPDSYREVHFENEQVLDLDSLSNLIFSRSYIPDRETEMGERVAERVAELFMLSQVDGGVRFRYQTKLYLGKF